MPRYIQFTPVALSDPDGHFGILTACFLIGVAALAVDLISGAAQQRTQTMFNDPSAYNIANWATAGLASTVKGAIAPEKPLSAQHWMDSLDTASLIMPVVNKVSSSSLGKAVTPKSSGNPFKVGQRVGTTQVGVDPNTLKLNTSINPVKYKAAKAKIRSEGMYGIVEVYSDGTVYNGNHRTLIGREQGISVDTIVIFH